MSCDNLPHDGGLDRRVPLAVAALRTAARDPEPLAFLRQPAVFGDLADQERFAGAFLTARARLRRDGARATVAAASP